MTIFAKENRLQTAQQSMKYWNAELGRAAMLFRESLINGNNDPRIEKHFDACFKSFRYWDNEVIKELSR